MEKYYKEIELSENMQVVVTRTNGQLSRGDAKKIYQLFRDTMAARLNVDVRLESAEVLGNVAILKVVLPARWKWEGNAGYCTNMSFVRVVQANLGCAVTVGYVSTTPTVGHSYTVRVEGVEDSEYNTIRKIKIALRDSGGDVRVSSLR